MTAEKYFSKIIFQCKCVLFFYCYLFLTVSQKKCLERGNGRSGTAVFSENLVAICTHDTRLWIWIYRWISMNISMDIHGKSMDMDMDMDDKFHMHGKPG